MSTKDETALLNTLGDFTSRENWDNFFTLRGTGDSFEWYAEWPSLRVPLLSQLSSIRTRDIGGVSAPQILVPGCGNSRISEYLYDEGFRNITNIDFSKVVVSDMLRRHVRSRPEMRWRVMDMTDMQFADGFFDVILDKGGLDALMEPELGPKLGSHYLSEVKRVLKSGGIYLCLTLAESHVLGLLFSKFRFGWKMSVHAIAHKPCDKPSFQTFMVVVAKENCNVLNPIVSSFDHSTLNCNGSQVHGLLQALESENRIRNECSSGDDILYSFEDLQLGAKGDLKELIPGRRFQLTLGEKWDSPFSCKAIVLDSQQQSDQFLYHCGVFLVPETRAHEWLFSSEEGQWMVVESSKAARLIMVFLDARHTTHASMDDIQKDLSPLVKNLAPGRPDNGAQIPFMMANDGVKKRNIIQQVTSYITGPIIVEDVIYENVDHDGSGLIQSKDLLFRRLTFQRSLGLVQSEALVTPKSLGDTERNKCFSSSKSRKRGTPKKNGSRLPPIDESRNNLKVDHSYLASSYHSGIISGFTLIASNLENVATSGRTVKTIIIGLGAGLLPMFLHGCMPFLDIQVVELDPTVLDLARDYFGFIEDKQLMVHIADGIQFVGKLANSVAPSEVIVKNEIDDSSKESLYFPNGSCPNPVAECKESTGIDLLIIDADSSDLSSGLTCPPADFIEESFLLSVKESLSREGLFIINLVSRSTSVREMVVSRMKSVFNHLFCLEVEEDVNAVLFALPTAVYSEDVSSSETVRLSKLLKLTHPEKGRNIIETAKKIKQLK